MDLQPHIFATQIKAKARELGFDLVGIAPATRSERADYFVKWIEQNQNGSMTFLANRVNERLDPQVYTPGVKSVICLAINYNHPVATNVPPGHGRIARYALGDDYHEIIKDKLHALADWMRQQFPQQETRCCVDTAPVMEKELASRAGVGWLGKNACTINPTIGSWLLLGEILTTLDLPSDEPSTDHCGTCTRCLEACPTGAITEPYRIDARKCISYLTIEHRAEIDEKLQKQIGNWLFGCDICQEVCPHNSKSPAVDAKVFNVRFADGTLDANAIVNWSPEQYQQTLRHSAMKRVKLPMLQRNAKIIRANSQEHSL